MRSLTGDGFGWAILGIIALAAGLCVVASVAMVRAILARYDGPSLPKSPWTLFDAMVPFGIWIALEFLGIQVLLSGSTAVLTSLVQGWGLDPATRAELFPTLQSTLVDELQPLLLIYSSVVRLGCIVYVISQAKLAGTTIERACGWTWPRLGPGFIGGVAIFFAIVPGWLIITEAWSVALESFQHTEPQAIVETFQVALAEGRFWLPAVVAFAAIVVAPLFEEMLFRGVLLKALIDGGLPPVASVLLTGAFFSLIHGSIAASIPLFLFGCVLGVVYLRTKTLWAPIVLHATFNASQIVAMSLVS
ncbi:MAG: CPBP family intramembrane glutamic endopeptidase [Planctomycetota bacterium]